MSLISRERGTLQHNTHTMVKDHALHIILHARGHAGQLCRLKHGPVTKGTVTRT